MRFIFLLIVFYSSSCLALQSKCRDHFYVNYDFRISYQKAREAVLISEHLHENKLKGSFFFLDNIIDRSDELSSLREDAEDHLHRASKYLLAGKIRRYCSKIQKAEDIIIKIKAIYKKEVEEQDKLKKKSNEILYDNDSENIATLLKTQDSTGD